MPLSCVRDIFVHKKIKQLSSKITFLPLSSFLSLLQTLFKETTVPFNGVCGSTNWFNSQIKLLFQLVVQPWTTKYYKLHFFGSWPSLVCSHSVSCQIVSGSNQDTGHHKAWYREPPLPICPTATAVFTWGTFSEAATLQVDMIGNCLYLSIPCWGLQFVENPDWRCPKAPTHLSFCRMCKRTA